MTPEEHGWKDVVGRVIAARAGVAPVTSAVNVMSAVTTVKKLFREERITVITL